MVDGSYKRGAIAAWGTLLLGYLYRYLGFSFDAIPANAPAHLNLLEELVRSLTFRAGYPVCIFGAARAGS